MLTFRCQFVLPWDNLYLEIFSKRKDCDEYKKEGALMAPYFIELMTNIAGIARRMQRKHRNSFHFVGKKKPNIVVVVFVQMEYREIQGNTGKCLHIELRTKLIVGLNGMFTLSQPGQSVCPPSVLSLTAYHFVLWVSGAERWGTTPWLSPVTHSLNWTHLYWRHTGPSYNYQLSMFQ